MTNNITLLDYQIEKNFESKDNRWSSRTYRSVVYRCKFKTQKWCHALLTTVQMTIWVQATVCTQLPVFTVDTDNVSNTVVLARGSCRCRFQYTHRTGISLSTTLRLCPYWPTVYISCNNKERERNMFVSEQSYVILR